MQGGPLPNFLTEDQIQRIFQKNDVAALGRAEIQFRAGLQKFGVIEVGIHIISEFPMYELLLSVLMDTTVLTRTLQTSL